MDRIQELSVFLSILDEGSLAAAARKWNLSPSIVTRLLNSLENRLGVRLLERTTRQMALTEAGAQLVSKARQLCTSYDELTKAASHQALSIQGHVHFSAPILFGEKYVSPILLEFLDRYPALSLRLNLSDHLANLIEDEIDMALRIGNMRDSSLICRRIGWLRRLYVASPDYLKRKGRPQSLEDLTYHECLPVGGDLLWQFRDQKKNYRRIRIKSRFIVNTAQPAIAAALKGWGIVPALSYQVSDYLKSGRLEIVLSQYEVPPLPINLVYPSTKLQPKRVRVLFDFLMDRFSQIPDIQLL